MDALYAGTNLANGRSRLEDSHAMAGAEDAASVSSAIDRAMRT